VISSLGMSSAETDFLPFPFAPDDDPFLAEALQILVQGHRAGLGLVDLQPLVVIGHDVVVR
jgi:hypothetical protein